MSSLFPTLTQQQQMQQQQLLQQKNQLRRNSDSQFHFAKNRYGPYVPSYPIPEDGPAPPHLPLPFNNPQYETPPRATRTHSGDYDPRVGTFASGFSLQPPGSGGLQQQQPQQQFHPLQQQYSPAFLQMQDSSKGLSNAPMSVSMSGVNQSFPNAQGMYDNTLGNACNHGSSSSGSSSSSSSSSGNSNLAVVVNTNNNVANRRSSYSGGGDLLHVHSALSHPNVSHTDMPTGAFYTPPNTSREYSAGLAGLGGGYGGGIAANLNTGMTVW
jgi:hypothetical protein